MHSERVYSLFSTDRTMGGLGDVAYSAQQAGYVSPEQMSAINTARLAAKTGQVVVSGTPEQKAAALEAAKMSVISMLPGGVYAVAFAAAFYAVAGLLHISSSSVNMTTQLMISRMWKSGAGVGILNAWDQAVHVLEATWNAFRAGRGLPPSPVRIFAGFLVPLDPVDRLTMPWPNEHLIDSNPNAGIGPNTIIQGADQCLLYWLYAYVDGWATRHGCYQYAGSSQATVQNTPLLGQVDPSSAGWEIAGRDWQKWVGTGPFGLLMDNWPGDCEGYSKKGETCQDLFAVCVRECWTYRLNALNKALPEVVGAAVAQSMMEQATVAAGVAKAKAAGAAATAALNAQKSASAKAQSAANIKTATTLAQEKTAKKFAIVALAVAGAAVAYKFSKKK